MRFINSVFILMAQECSSVPNIDESVLPRWDMQKLYGYADLEDKKYLSDFEALNNRASAFRTTYYGHLSERLEDALKEYSEITQKYRNLDQFVGSVQSIHRDDSDVIKRYTAYSTKRGEVHGQQLEWLALQLIELDQQTIDAWLSKSAYVKSLESWLIQTRLLKGHVLPEAVEEALTLRENWYGASPVVEYFNNMLVQARYKFPKAFLPANASDEESATGAPTPETPSDPASHESDYVELNESRLLNYLLDPSWKVREATLKTFNSGLASNMITHFSCLSLNQVAGKEAIENKARNWPTIRAARNVGNMLSDEVVDALLEVVRTEGVRINKRFYNLKKKILEKKTGRKEFTWADRNAPLGLSAETGKRHEWSECVAIIDEAFGNFSSSFAKMFDDLVSGGRIDAPASSGKRGGAFCMLGTPDIGPAVFTNYLGKDEDVSTVAHECGHAIHGILTYKQPLLMQEPSMSIAEVASIFGEMLVFKKLLLNEPNKEAQLEKLMTKLNAIMNTVVRQISFDRFEELVHENKKSGGFVPEEDMKKYWRQATEEFYGTEGEVFTSLADSENLWSYVPHFHELPFYVYSYAFADLTVGTLYSLYEKNVFPSCVKFGSPDAPATPVKSFQERFINLLSTGSSEPFVDMVAHFDLDGAKPAYWKSAFVDYIEPLLVQAEELAEQI